ncbi:YaaA family protein [Rothia sp. ZJ932]|uniref:YaaA family protein n=1 Tax=Rothia sp. ZJ932 TaxID=2810516 RepID=UPI0019675968|nr:peroxide stress protein YaaA [Rothia sp. ZJ932]QRZ62374.1 peroxide stress protein YaaA [Rothia sp. ZJ932]
MKILLPPSEGKCAALAGEPVDVDALSFPFLIPARESVAEVLRQVSGEVDALTMLKVGASLSAEVERNTRVFEEPAHEAWRVYTGVLFEALNVASMSDAERQVAFESVLVVSALWGAVHLDDVIPAYRLSMGVKLPQVGDLAKFWRSELAPLNGGFAGELMVDCRSAAYSKAWVTPSARTVQVRVERLFDDGSRKVVSHMAKHYRGELARYLVVNGLVELADARELAEAVGEQWQVELVEPAEKKPGVLTLVIPE